jgi:protein involved in sex pheromone biosynthesis
MRKRLLSLYLSALVLFLAACSNGAEMGVDDIVVREPGTLDEQLLAVDEYLPGFGECFTMTAAY